MTSPSPTERHSDHAPDAGDLDRLIGAALKAGAVLLPYFRHGAATLAAVNAKLGGSPVTEADHLANALLRKDLTEAFPRAAWLSEEDPDDPVRLQARDVLIVDPIDGTRAFMAGDPRFAISIALARNGRPLLGVLHAPALRVTFAASAGQGAILNGKALRVRDSIRNAELRVAGPKTMIEILGRAALSLAPLPRIPSLALRLAQVASDELDIALAAGASHDWDIAAADLIVHEAGGRVSDLHGNRPHYNLQDPSHAALVAAPAALHEITLGALRREGPPNSGASRIDLPLEKVHPR
jgi:myo-inositol-1(or 4)-monophosphatase